MYWKSSSDTGGINMGNLAGEAENGGLRLAFDGRLRLEFPGDAALASPDL